MLVTGMGLEARGLLSKRSDHCKTSTQAFIIVAVPVCAIHSHAQTNPPQLGPGDCGRQPADAGLDWLKSCKTMHLVAPAEALHAWALQTWAQQKMKRRVLCVFATGEIAIILTVRCCGTRMGGWAAIEEGHSGSEQGKTRIVLSKTAKTPRMVKSHRSKPNNPSG